MGVQPQADLAGGAGRGRGQGRGMGPCGFSQGEGGGRGGRPTPLSPAERVFAEVRRWVEGRRYERIEAKKAAGEGVLRGLEAEKRVSSLVGRPYIRQAPHALRSCVFRKRSQYQKASLRSGQRLRRRLRGRQPPVFEFHSQERRYPPLVEIQKAYLNAPQRTTLVTKAYLHTL